MDQVQVSLQNEGVPVTSVYRPLESEDLVVHLDGGRVLKIVGAGSTQAIVDAVRDNQELAATTTPRMRWVPTEATIALGG